MNELDPRTIACRLIDEQGERAGAAAGFAACQRAADGDGVTRWVEVMTVIWHLTEGTASCE